MKKSNTVYWMNFTTLMIAMTVSNAAFAQDSFEHLLNPDPMKIEEPKVLRTGGDDIGLLEDIDFRHVQATADAIGVDAVCEVKLDTNKLGEPENIRPNCSDPRFIWDVSNAVAQARFRPKIVRGKPEGRVGIVVPISIKSRDPFAD